MKSNVYFVKSAGLNAEERLTALSKILSGFGSSFKFDSGEIVPVKITIGDSQCVYNVSAELIKQVVFKIKSDKAKPFLFDTSVIYTGQRQNAVDHLNLVQNKGISHSKTGAPFVVADGLLGQDGREFEIDSPHIKKIKVPSFIGMLDSLVVLTHATGHVFSGYAGSIKNVAMGMSCRPTKQVQHSSMKPSVIKDKCSACGCCVSVCPVGAISLNKPGKAQIKQDVCIGCGECLCACKFDAVFVNWQEDVEVFCRRMCDAAKFIDSQFKKKFYITFAFDITQECDCISTKNDKMISKDIGILASEDILSLDKAVSDLMTDEIEFLKHHDAYKKMFDYAEKIGLGSLDYNLVAL